MKPQRNKIDVSIVGLGAKELMEQYEVALEDLFNLPATLRERNYNPCNDVVLVPDVAHPAFPSNVKNLLQSSELVGEMASGFIVNPSTEEVIRKMGRYETLALYNRMMD